MRSSSEQKSKGPDGKEGTSDDGLPVTYNEFFDLLNEMRKNAGIRYPISFPGVDNGYVTLLAAAMANDYAGYEGAMANYAFTGKAEVIDGDIPETVSYDGSLATKTIDVTMETGYELAKQVSKYYALDFLKTLMNGDGEYYSANCLSTSYYHTESQSDFISSKYSNTKTGILIDGTWWENEATGAFNDLQQYPGSSKTERNFGMMPYPRPYVTSGTYEQTFTTVFSPLCMVNSNIKPEQEKVVKAFLRFAHTDEALSDFTEIVSVPLAYDYEIQDTENLSSYAKSLWELRKNSKTVYPLNENLIYVYDGESHTLATALDGSDGVADLKAYRQFRDDDSKAPNWTVKQMMESMVKRSDDLWKTYNSVLFSK